ncbi:MAG: LysM peptidoglycan-binding domain-containing protein [Chloroflexi bacterium]|nr:LysM peptidoglycan-binding domain-containing protein [Chloroflexota bacterium]MCI0574685.1 LysM peptidoglycan-binding domain-containing protein [Chloroflexota bacterium]MCI0647422.1 LysM peptidoglycan-binding domain-containing protein [Chloroflexota bacterium]MCI0726870.1 LysM peptidoglycan-binding domain-containing protein [Chloroflexota bacterium]
MANTRGGLVAARIYEVDESGNEVGGGISVDCMFNPFEYSVSKTNTYEEKTKNKSDAPKVEFKKAGAQTLKLNLTFDTYESGEDVSLETNKLWKLMESKTRQGGGKNNKVPPPEVAFEWGVFKFVSVITNMTQKFTLFKNDGTPVRAAVDVTFTQHKDLNDYPGQNPTSGGGPIERVWQVKAGDRLDTIAAAVYSDATKWRLIATHNRIVNPLALRSGQRLNIPED